MKFKHKELFVGIVLGAMIFGGISIFADGTLNVYPNPFKITVNGVEKNIEGYNINEYSYFKLRDIGEQVGFDVDFKEDTIMINNNNNDDLATNDEETQDEEIKNIDADIIEVSGEKYYYFQFINKNILEYTYILPEYINNEDYVLNLYKRSSNEVVLQSIPSILYCDHKHISEKYLNEVILPLDK